MESLLECRRVCKTWLPYFSDMHLRRQSVQFGYGNSINGGAAAMVGVGGLLFLCCSSKGNGYPLYYGEYDENNNKNSYKMLRRIDHCNIKRRVCGLKSLPSMVGSRNGLICFAEPHGRKVADPVHFCNPITRECKYLPRLDINHKYKSVVKICCGFGYLPTTNEYKVVRIYYHADKPSEGRVQVYTLGGGNGWRNKGEITYSLPSSSPGLFANGALHWLEETEGKIVAFDLAVEEFNLVPLPPGLPSSSFRLKVLGECLCALYCNKNNERATADAWLFKKTNNSTSITSAIKEQQKYQSWSWIKEFSIALGRSNFHSYNPFGLTKNGEFIFSSGSFSADGIKIISCYDPKTENLEQLVNMKFIEAIPHMNSFVSLKALGEKCRKRKRSMLK